MDTFRGVLKGVEIFTQTIRNLEPAGLNDISAVKIADSFESSSSSNDSLFRKAIHLESRIKKRTIEINVKSDKSCNFKESDNESCSRNHFVTKYRFHPAAAFQTSSDVGMDHSQIMQNFSKGPLTAKVTKPAKKRSNRGIQTNITRVESVRNRFFERHLLGEMPTLYTDFSDTELDIKDEKSTQTNKIYVNSPTQSRIFPRIIQKLKKPKRRITWNKAVMKTLLKRQHSIGSFSSKSSEEIKSMISFEQDKISDTEIIPLLESSKEIKIPKEFVVDDFIPLEEGEAPAEASTGHSVKTKSNEMSSLFSDSSSEGEFKSLNILLENAEELAGPSTGRLNKNENFFPTKTETIQSTNQEQKTRKDEENAIEITKDLCIADDMSLEELGESKRPPLEHSSFTTKTETESPRTVGLHSGNSSKEELKSIKSLKTDNSFQSVMTPCVESTEQYKINEIPKELVIDDDILLDKAQELGGPSTGRLNKNESFFPEKNEKIESTIKKQEPQKDEERTNEITKDLCTADEISFEELEESRRSPIEPSSFSTKTKTESPRTVGLHSENSSKEELKSIKSLKKDNSFQSALTPCVESTEQYKLNEISKELVIDDDILLDKAQELAGPSTGHLNKNESFFPEKKEKIEPTIKKQEPQKDEERPNEITKDLCTADEIFFEELEESTRSPIEHSSFSTKTKTESPRAVGLHSENSSKEELKSIKSLQKDNSFQSAMTPCVESTEQYKLNEIPKELVIDDDILLDKAEELAGPSTGRLNKTVSFFSEKTKNFELSIKKQKPQKDEEMRIEITKDLCIGDDISLEELEESTRSPIEPSSFSTKTKTESPRAVGLQSENSSKDVLNSIKSLKKDNSFQSVKTPCEESTEQNNLNEIPKELVIDDDILLDKPEELAGPSTGHFIKEDRSKQSFLLKKTEEYSDLMNKKQKLQMGEDKSIRISKEFLIVDDNALKELGESTRTTFTHSFPSTKIGSELKKTEQLNQIEEDKLIEISDEISLSKDIHLERSRQQTGSTATYSMEHKNSKSFSSSKNSKKNTDRMNPKVKEEKQFKVSNEIVIKKKILSKELRDDTGNQTSTEKSILSTTKKYAELNKVEHMSPLEEDDSIGLSKELLVSNNILSEEFGEPAGPKIESSMTHNKSNYSGLTKADKIIKGDVDKSSSEQKSSRFSRSHSVHGKSTSKGFLVPLAREQLLEHNSVSNEVNVLIDVSNIYVKRQPSENKNAESVGNDTKTLKLAPEDAINKIKSECWNNELLIIIIPHNCDAFDEADLLEVHTVDRIYKLHLGSFCFPKSQLGDLEKGGIFRKYFAFLSSNYLTIDNELESIIRHTRYLIDRGCFCEIKNVPKQSSPNVTEIFKKYNGLRVRSDELEEIFKLAEKRNFKIYARPEYRNTEHTYILDFFTENSHYLGTVSATNKTILKQLKIYRQIVKNVNVIFDVNELVLPNGLRQVLFDIADTFGVMYLYDRLGVFLFEMYKRFS